MKFIQKIPTLRNKTFPIEAVNFSNGKTSHFLVLHFKYDSSKPHMVIYIYIYIFKSNLTIFVS